ncbi:MAG TPA: ATP-binding protein [Trebonia sp.]|nr:ATP-binding protein [Trebonia sp.]
MEWPLLTGLGPVSALPTAARLARAFTRTIVAHWGLSGLAEDCELVISELVANVVQAATAADGIPWHDERGGAPLLWVRLLSDGVRLRVEVWDNLPRALGVPEPRRPARNEESGRGLGIVRAVSQDWGWDHVPRRGPDCHAKRVWAILEKS